MKKGVFIFVVCLLDYVRSARTGSETVWLKDVTTRFQIDKRKLSDLDLPDHLTFHLTRGSDVLALNLKRNYEIDPNADIYVVQTLKDGPSYLAKTEHLEKEALAYYQDTDNGAFMTVRYIKRSDGQNHRVINGNIRIGDRSYDLRPEETDVTSRNLLEVQSLLGKRYVLLDQANIQRESSVENTDAENVNEQNVEQEYIAHPRRFLHGQDKHNHLSRADNMLSSRFAAGLHSRGKTDTTRDVNGVYYVEVAVLIDSSIWDLYSSTVETTDPLNKRNEVQRKIREAYSHIINGINLRYKEIGDTSISISVTLADIIFFQGEVVFPHKSSNVTIVDGKTYIDVYKYLKDLSDWDKTVGVNHKTDYDHAMLFTWHNLYENSTSNGGIGGIANQEGVCITGDRTSVIMARDYSRTVKTATHELGHSLGAEHDGYGDASDCKADDFFIMTPNVLPVNRTLPHSRNPWLFSNCSVEAFKKKLKFKQCLTNIGIFYNVDEWTMHTKKQPAEVFTPDEQCHLMRGPNSVFCGRVHHEICNMIRCTDPKTGKCRRKYYSAARGTQCGRNKWCIESRCVSKRQDETNECRKK